jgi:hypothetical protein
MNAGVGVLNEVLALCEVIKHFGLCPFCEHAEAIDTDWDVDCRAFAKSFDRPKMICAKFKAKQGLAEQLLKALARKE